MGGRFGPESVAGIIRNMHIENRISQVILKASFYRFVGESRNFDRLDLL
jgi:hypothetical protein